MDIADVLANGFVVLTLRPGISASTGLPLATFVIIASNPSFYVNSLGVSLSLPVLPLFPSQISGETGTQTYCVHPAKRRTSANTLINVIFFISPSIIQHTTIFQKKTPKKAALSDGSSTHQNSLTDRLLS